MKYPVTKADLIKDLAADDEIATLICVEAIISNTFSDLEINDETQREQIKSNVLAWPGFNDFSEMISSQKSLLNSPLAGTSSGVNLDLINEDSLKTADKLASRTITKIKSSKENSGINRSRITVLSGLAVACTIAFLFISASSIISNQSAGRKSSSTLTSSERKSIESSTNKADQITTDTPTGETSFPYNSRTESGIESDISEIPTSSNSTNPEKPTTVIPDTSSSEAENKQNSGIAISIIAVPIIMLAGVAFIYKKRSK